MWFSFLKNGGAGGLLDICEHNLKDIRGLACIFAALARIAEDPKAAPETYRVDSESLALRWFYAAKSPGPEQRLAEELLRQAADRACPRAVYVWAKELFRRGGAEEGRRRLRALAAGNDSGGIRAAACRLLAVDAEWRLRDIPLALSYTEIFFTLEHTRTGLRDDMAKRRERLRAKLAGAEGAG
jgi:hypothetical protein